MYSTCTPWAGPSDLCEPCSDFSISQPLLNNCLQAASDILFSLSGRQFAGVCQDTVRPEGRFVTPDHGRPIRAGVWGYGYQPAAGGYIGGDWGMPLCNRSERSACTALPEITLGVYPLTEIVQIKIDGAVIDPGTYDIADNKYLVRTAPNVSAESQSKGWPCCNDMALPDTEIGTWSVTFNYGMPPPVSGVMACAELACQLVLASTPSTVGSCKLLTRVTQITRQGLTAVVADPLAFLKDGKTGLTLCDMFLTQVNPHGLRRRSTVSSPDIGRRVRRVG